ncbi:hypothetical protein N7476_004511 [Penicillium atrosanguineum]|uniref:Uncharacterized protein n=1 Tax=Penicillium atrosanguineum TaxID=1132637 RepID=A0A9W9Q2C0_9EURO|nr:hypothetical protein N7476_004511 [Penicillium atrosanguineum]
MPTLRSAGLLALPFMQLAQAIAFKAPVPTDGPQGQLYNPARPETTPGLDINSPLLQRRDSTWAYTQTGYMQASANVCGYWNGDSNAGIQCAEDFTCVFHTTTDSNDAFPGMVGCCQSKNCAFETFCYDSSKVSATPSLTKTFDAFGMYCTDSSAPACISYTYPDLGVQEFGCGATADISSIYTTASPLTMTASTETLTSVLLWTVADEFLSSYTSSWSSRYGSTAAPKNTGVSSASATATSTGTQTESATGLTETTSTASSSSSSQPSSSSNTGAIAGGVVGGVVGTATVVGAIFFWLRRSKKQRQQDAAVDGAGDGYRAIPGGQTPSAWGMQTPAEMEGNYAPHKYPEFQGDIPDQGALRVAGMQERDTDEVYEMDSGEAITRANPELPTDYDIKHKTEGNNPEPKEPKEST